MTWKQVTTLVYGLVIEGLYHVSRPLFHMFQHRRSNDPAR